MYLKQTVNKKTGRTHISMAHNYRDKEKGCSRTKIIKSFGYLDELEKIHDDPIAYYRRYVDEQNEAAKQADAEYIVTAKKNQVIEQNTNNRRNYGYVVIMKVFYELGLERFLLNRQQRDSKVEFNTGTIMKLLLISRILSPGSKKKAYEERERYFDFEGKKTFELANVYRCLSFFIEYDKDIQQHIHERITKKYGRNLDLVYYDITNYYFEIDIEDDLRKKGYSKENRKSPIVQMGLSMDAEGLPISYELFPGNESEKLHLRPMVFEVRSRYASERVIAVADCAQNTGNNIYYLDSGRQGYVFSQSIAGGGEEFKKYVIDPAGYEWYGEKYKRKSRVEKREIYVDFERGDGTMYKKKVLVDQRQIIFYSEKYAIRSREKREAVIKKAQKIIENPAAYTAATSYGALKYVKNVEVDKKTGELKQVKANPCFDMEKIMEEEKYDGYYALVTNVFNDGKNKYQYDDDKIIEIYRGLWRIEDSFRVTKTEFEARPVYLSREERIKAHFLICFIALVVMRLIQKRMNQKYSAAVIIETLNKISCSYEGGNLFLFDYRSEVADDLGRTFDMDFTRTRLTRQEIKSNLAEIKEDKRA